jgi:thioredoxin reductase
VYHEYLIVGAGPGGLQLGYFMERAGRDYLILERANVSGAFFTVYPRHDRLISINKRNTGQINKEFNLRHDWNSLISDDPSLKMGEYSKIMFPDRKDLVQYLNDYQKKLGIKVQHNTNVNNIRRVFNESGNVYLFHMNDQDGNEFICKYLVIATGLSSPNIPTFGGVEHTIGYEDMSTDPMDYEGKSVLVLGRGNTAFEVADSIYGNTNYVHMIGRSRVRLSWATHYVGDLRAVNNALLDTYQLKSLDGVLEAPMEEAAIVKQPDGTFKVQLAHEDEGQDSVTEEADLYDNFALRDPYHIVIRCLGWKFDDSIFTNESKPDMGKGRRKKFPMINADFQSKVTPNLYFAGTNTHSLDFRKSAGGFIHGFRYTARALHRILEQRNHDAHWPSKHLSLEELVPFLVHRLNEASGPYQMVAELMDVAVINSDGSFEYVEEFPVNLLHEFSSVTGIQATQVIAIVLEYGKYFSGPNADVFRQDRATGEPSEAHRSNFLHPVLYYYQHLPTATDMASRSNKETLPRPTRQHHTVEDFLSMWDTPLSHVKPIRLFIEDVVQKDVKQYFAEECFHLALTHKHLPRTCEVYLAGQGLVGSEDMLLTAHATGMLFS